MEWISIETPKGYMATIPRDESGNYCPICGYFLREYSFDGEEAFLCSGCHIGPGVHDLPPMEDGKYSDYLTHAKSLRARFLWFEGYGKSALQQVSVICPNIHNELDQYTIPGKPAVVYWQRLDEESVACMRDVGKVIKCMLCTETRKFMRRSSSEHAEDRVGILCYMNMTLSDEEMNRRLRYLQESREGYYKTPPPDAVWI